MNITKTIILILLVAAIIIILASNANKGTDLDSSVKDLVASPYKIGLIVPTLDNPYFIDLVQAAKTEVGKNDSAKLLVQAPEQGPLQVDRQIDQIDNMLSQSVDLLLLVPADSKAVIPSLVKYEKANVPVIILDNNLDEASAAAANLAVKSFIGSDNFLGGQKAGEFIANKLSNKGIVAILEGVSGTEAAIDRKEGFQDALSNYPGMQIAASQTANWSREEALNVVPNIISANSNLDAIFASNDEMALGAIRALESLSNDSILVVGYDAIDDAIAAVEDGTLEATIAQQPKEMGRLGVQKALEVLAGNSIEIYIPTPLEVITK